MAKGTSPDGPSQTIHFAHDTPAAKLRRKLKKIAPRNIDAVSRSVGDDVKNLLDAAVAYVMLTNNGSQPWGYLTLKDFGSSLSNEVSGKEMGNITKEEATDAATALWEFVQWGKKLFTPLWPSIIDIFETLKRTVDGTCQLRTPDYDLWKRAGKDGEPPSTWEPLDKNDADPSLRLLARLSAPGRYELTPWRRGTAAHMLKVIRDTDAYADPGSKSFLADLSQLEIVAGVMLLANRSRDDGLEALSRKITSLRDIIKVDQQRLAVADKRINKFFAREAKAREMILVPGMGDYARGYWFARFEELGPFGARNDHDLNKKHPDDVDEPAVIVPILWRRKRMAEVLEENRGGRPAAAPKWTMAPAPAAVAEAVEGQVKMFEEPGIKRMLLELLWFHAHILDAILAKGSRRSFAQSEDYFERHFRFLEWVVARRQVGVRSKLDGLPEGDVETAHANLDLLQYEDISKAIANRKRLFEGAKKWAYGREPHDKQAGGEEDPVVEKRGANSASNSEPEVTRARYVPKEKEELANKSPWEVLTRSLRDPSGLVLGKDEDGTKIALFTILMDEGGRKPWFDHTLSFWKSRLYAPAILANRLQHRPWRLPESEDTHELIADIYEKLYSMAASKVQSGELGLPFSFPFEDESLKRLPILEKEGSGSKKTVGDSDSANLTGKGLAGSLAPEKRREHEQFSFLSHHPSEDSSWEAMPTQLKQIQQLVDEEERELMNRFIDRTRASESVVDTMQSEDEVRTLQNGGIWSYRGIPRPPVQPIPSEPRKNDRNSENIRAPGGRVDEWSTMSAERLRRSQRIRDIQIQEHCFKRRKLAGGRNAVGLHRRGNIDGDDAPEDEIPEEEPGVQISYAHYERMLELERENANLVRRLAAETGDARGAALGVATGEIAQIRQSFTTQRTNYMRAIVQWQLAVSEIRRIQLHDQETGFLTPATEAQNRAWYREVTQNIAEHVAEANGQQLTEYGTHVDLPPNYRPSEEAAPSAAEEPRRSPQARALALANTRVTRQQDEIQRLTQELRRQTRHAQTRISGLERDNEGLKRDNDDLLGTNRELVQENRRVREAFRQAGVEPPAYSAGFADARENRRSRSRSPYREPEFGRTGRYRQRSPMRRSEGAPPPPPRAETSRTAMTIRFGRRQEPANERTSPWRPVPTSLVLGRRQPGTPSHAPIQRYIRRSEQDRSIGASGQQQYRERPFASMTPRDQARNRSRMPDWQPTGEPASRRSRSRQRGGSRTTGKRFRAERSPPEQQSQERHPRFGGLTGPSYTAATTSYEEDLTEEADDYAGGSRATGAGRRRPSSRSPEEGL